MLTFRAVLQLSSSCDGVLPTIAAAVACHSPRTLSTLYCGHKNELRRNIKIRNKKESIVGTDGMLLGSASGSRCGVLSFLTASRV